MNLWHQPIMLFKFFTKQANVLLKCSPYTYVLAHYIVIKRRWKIKFFESPPFTPYLISLIIQKISSNIIIGNHRLYPYHRSSTIKIHIIYEIINFYVSYYITNLRISVSKNVHNITLSPCQTRKTALIMD